MLVAQRLDLPVFGVNLPNLFVLTYQLADQPLSFYINCYNRGVVLSRADIEHYVGQLGITSQDSFYEPCSNLDIVCRAMRNLQVSFEKLQELGKAEEVGQLLAILTEKKKAEAEEDDEDED
jgi:regulator of sirC expression with transglutaminase-like and TPR domain